MNSYLRSTMINLYARTSTQRLMKIWVLFLSVGFIYHWMNTQIIKPIGMQQNRQRHLPAFLYLQWMLGVLIRFLTKGSLRRAAISLERACWSDSSTSVFFPFRSIRNVPLLHVADRRPSSRLIHPPPPHAFKSKTGGCDWPQQVNREHLFTSSTQVNILRVSGCMSELAVCV